MTERPKAKQRQGGISSVDPKYTDLSLSVSHFLRSSFETSPLNFRVWKALIFLCFISSFLGIFTKHFNLNCTLRHNLPWLDLMYWFLHSVPVISLLVNLAVSLAKLSHFVSSILKSQLRFKNDSKTNNKALVRMNFH